MNEQPENSRTVKEKLTAALFALMQEKRFSEISVTELVQRADVSRQSYYRHFDSKEAIIENFLNEAHISGRENFTRAKADGDVRRAVVQALGKLRENREALLVLYHSGFAKDIQENIDQLTETIFGDMPANSPERYKLYAHAGAIMNVAVKWLESGAKESCEEMAKVICEYRAEDILENYQNANFDDWSARIRRQG